MKQKSKKKGKGKKKRGEELFRGRLVPALVVIIPLIIAGVVILLLESGMDSSSLGTEPSVTDRLEEREEEEHAEEGETPPGVGDSDSPERLRGEAPAEAKGTLYIVLDDVGYETDNLERFLSLPIPITYAILPKLPDTPVSVEKIHEAGAEYILHQPMEPIGKEDPGPGAIYGKMEQREVGRILSENLKDLPKARGINNHMGSKGTSDARLMNEVLDVLGERELFFLDSRTTAESVAGAVAKKKRIPFTERNVFLDNESSEEYIRSALEEGKRIAARKGYAILIGHVWSGELYEVLERRHSEIRKEGYRFGSITELFHRETADADTGN